ncbi:pentatricopeptide repeat-containing protein At1g80550, mitochondrial-like isoform X1 [Cicer arietinum]|uniref:pentatricopeptide repeat-containing protein At1g80550, mitochondrial-like isoform X1 n=1 Tax=Cicer arietinum TaxID=3827 RepID=UPI003CC5CC9A
MRWPFPLTSSSTRLLRFRFIPFQSHSSHHNNFSTHNPISVPITNPVLDQTTVRETLTSFNNDWKRALEFFNWVQTEFNFPHSTETYNLILDILGKFFEFQQCWNLIHRMQSNPNSFPNHTTFRVMFKRYISAHCIDDAVQAFQRLNEFNLKDETSFSNLIDALCDHKHVLEAQDLVFGTQKTLTLSWKIDGFVVSSNNTKIYNIVLRGWYKLGWWSKCWEFWDEMDRIGVQKDLHSYSIYMDILSKGGKPWKAVKLFKEMKRKATCQSSARCIRKSRQNFSSMENEDLSVKAKSKLAYRWEVYHNLCLLRR